jgi:hypothetical protein
MNIEELVRELESNPDMVNNLTEEQLEEIEKKLNPYGSTIYGDEKYTCISFTNLREKYMTKLLTTSLIGFTYQMAREHKVDVDNLNDTFKVNKNDFKKLKQHPDKMNTDLITKIKDQAFNEFILKKKEGKEDSVSWSEEEEIEINTDANKYSEDVVNSMFTDREYFDLDEMARAEEENSRAQAEQEKAVIQRFLDNLFKYDPEYHATNSFNKENMLKDIERTGTGGVGDIYNEVPNDTYNRFQMYYDVNYEKLRSAVMYLYSEKPDIEVAINVFDSFDSLDQAKNYVEKNKSKIVTNMYTLTNNKWNLLGSFKENRQRMDFYNKNTVILENILKQKEEDAKVGSELLKKRVKKVKTKNIKTFGKDDPKFDIYKKQNLDGVYDTTITKIIENDDDTITVESSVEISDTGAMIDSDGVPEDALEIKVTSVNAKTGSINVSNIYTKAEAPVIPDN